MIYSVRGGRKSERLRERERSEWMEDGDGQIMWVWGWSGEKKKLAPFLRQNTSCERGGERWLERKRWVMAVARS